MDLVCVGSQCPAKSTAKQKNSFHDCWRVMKTNLGCSALQKPQFRKRKEGKLKITETEAENNKYIQEG